MPQPSLSPSERHAILRQFAGAQFRISAYAQAFGRLLQLITVVLASFPYVATLLQPGATWIVLGLAAGAPLSLWAAQSAKNAADDLLRRVELADGLGRELSQLEIEDRRESATSLTHWLAQRERLDLTPYASAFPPGPLRLVANVRESAWWSKHLAGELARWHTLFAAALAIICVAVLFRLAQTDAVVGRQDIAQFAAAVLILVFSEGLFRTGRELAAFGEAAAETFRDADLLLAGPVFNDAEALLLVNEYQIARHAAPRISTLWHRMRQRSLNAAWHRGNAALS